MYLENSRARDLAGPPATDRWWDLPSILLLTTAILIAAGRLAITRWTDHLDMVPLLAFLGLLAGLALGKSSFSPRLAALFALLYGLFAVPWRLGLILGPDLLWTERLVSLAGRLIFIFGQIARQEPIRDPLLFLSLMSILFWTLSVHAGYSLTRHRRAWQAILPAGLVLLIVQVYDRFAAFRVWLLAAYLFLAVLLLARLTYLHHHLRWRRTRTFLPLVSLNVALFPVLIAATLVLTAWTVPALAEAVPAARETWRQVTQEGWSEARDRLDDFFASLRGTVYVVGNYYGEHLALGRGNEIADTMVMTVEAPPNPAPGVRYYWRARVYDHYADGRWTSTVTATQTITPTRIDLDFPEMEGRTAATFDFVAAVPLVTVYAPPEPFSISRPARAELALGRSGFADLAALHFVQPLQAGETYRVRSSLSSATIGQLRAAGTDYPDWVVTDRYLQLPSTVTPRTRELAREIAGDAATPYDAVAAITTYLRRDIRYIEIIPTPPTDQEPLDWFLFDLRQGFCNYYATGEVILLRSLGIPARLAVGFAQGERREGGNIYLVRQYDAHAWPEVYFPGLGWVQFEPTASQPSISRPLDEREPTDPLGPDPEDRLPEPEEFAEFEPVPDDPVPAPIQNAPDSPITWGVLLSLGLLLAFFTWRARRQWGAMPALPVLLERGISRLGLRPPAFLHRWAHRVALTPLERAYLELNAALNRLGAPPDVAHTPAERAATLARLLPATAEAVRQLLAEYHATAYGPRPGDPRVARQAARAIRGLSWRARLRQMLRRDKFARRAHTGL